MADETDAPGDLEITKDILETPDAIVAIGTMASQSLKYFGSVTFMVDPNDDIRMVNHFNVYINSAAVYPPDTEPRFLRPILVEPKPQYVALNPQDGTLWEVDYPDEEAPVANEQSG